MSGKEELLSKIPEAGFLKIAESKSAPMSAEKRVALIRKGNELFNQKKYELAKKIFLTTGYSDGLIRLGDLYLEQGQSLEAFRMYWLAPHPRMIDTMVEQTVTIIKKWLKEADHG